MPDFFLVFLSQSWHGNTVGKKGYLLHLAHPCYLLAMRATGYESGMVDLRNSPQKKKSLPTHCPLCPLTILTDFLMMFRVLWLSLPLLSMQWAAMFSSIYHALIHLCYLFFCRWHHFSQTEESQNQSSKVRAVYSSKV